jgi:UDP-N-acetylmuramoyl-tripeptide--D-alanyl-D-alanine ligase
LFTGIFSPISLKKLPRPTLRAVSFSVLQLLLILSGCLFLPLKWWVGYFLLLLLIPFHFLAAALVLAVVEKVLVRILVSRAEGIVGGWKKSGLQVLGVTGSFGKTTTVSFLQQLLSCQYRVLTPPLGVNVEKAIAWWIVKNRKIKGDFLLVELAAYQRGEIASVCSWIKPEVAVITGIGRQHLALFGSLNDLLSAKAEILQFAKVVFFNGESPASWQIAKKFSGQKVFYGRGKKMEYRLAASEFEVFWQKGWQARQRFVIESGGKKWRGEVEFLGEQLLVNLVGAVAVADYLKVERRLVEKAFRKLKLPERRLEVKTGKRGCLILDSRYNLSGASLLAGLAILERLDFQEKIVVLGCLLELGKRESLVYRRLRKSLIRVADLVLVKEKSCFEKWSGREEKFRLVSGKEVEELLESKGKRTALLVAGK